MSEPAAHECTYSQQLTEAKNELHRFRRKNEALQNLLRRAVGILHQDDSELSADFESEDDVQRTRKRKRDKSVSTSDLVYIFIDDSNVTHEGSRELDIGKGFNFNVDYNRLVTKVLNGRELGKVYIVGSTPPSKAELQERSKDLGFTVTFFPRNASNKEKKVDAQLICDMMRTIYTESPAKLVLVAGDSDYSISLTEARERNWEVETWFWSKGMSNDFKSWSFLSLEPHHKSFVYITGPTTDKPTLEIRGEIIKSWKWRDAQIMECFHACASDLLCQFHWVNDTTAHLYFDTKAQLKHAKVSISNKYPNKLTVSIKGPERDNRRGSRGRNPSRNANSRDWNRSNRSSNLQIDSEPTNRSSNSEESIIEKLETETENH